MLILQAFNGLLYRIGSVATILFMAIIAIVVPYEVIGRYLFQKMNIWTGEVSTYSLVWASMMGGSIGLKKGYQVSMTSLMDALPAVPARLLGFVCYLFTLFFFGVMFSYGVFQTAYNLKQTSPAIGLIMSIPYAALPAGFFIMFFFTLEEFLKFLRAAREGAGR
jgi:TRAP-type C4-dicarboxylate transport system permease small subunit